MCNEVLNFLNNGVLDKRWNETELLLIPKSKDAQTVEDYRPISLCNVVMKIVTKVIANRMKVCLSEVFSEYQSAFISGQLITDNILMAHELTHKLKHLKKSNEGFLSIKVDMSKAFDRVDWRFLRQMMLKLGFAESLVDKIMMCVEFVTFKVKINGQESEVISPGRGIRQGDPLSPLLFIIC